jgi:hypothetical protein
VMRPGVSSRIPTQRDKAWNETKISMKKKYWFQKSKYKVIANLSFTKNLFYKFRR